MTTVIPRCARCGIKTPDRRCQDPEGKSPDFCPTQHYGEIVQAAVAEMQKPEIAKFALAASVQEGEGYCDREKGYDQVHPGKPRIQETIEFAHKMGYRRIGLAFCMGLVKEARVVEQLLSDSGFEVVSALCKVGAVDKSAIGVTDDQKIRIGAFEPLCNPIAQAMVMNTAGTEFNIVVGLCVGHDALFLKYADAMCTVLAAKDRLLGHNPLAAIYTIDSYYRALK